jgi:regulator of sigma E protease
VALVPQKAVYTNVFGDDISYFDFGISGVAEPFAIVGEVMEEMPAAQAGLQEGDRIISIDGRKLQYWEQMQKIVTGSQGKVLRFDVQRDNRTLTMHITPELVKDRNLSGVSSKNYRIGIRPPELVPDADKITIKLSLAESFTQSCRILVRVTGSFFDFLKNAFKGKVSRELVGGPIRIAQMAQQSAQRGVVELFSFVAAISLQLAILNLLPIPVLDGGHLMFYSIEAIKRGPLSTRARETAQQVGLFLLLLLMIFVIYNDIEFTFF